MKQIALAIVGALVLAGTAQAVTLVNPDGTPIGGQWQQWADEMRVPSVSGTLVIAIDPAECAGAGACSTGPYPGGTAWSEVWLSSSTVRRGALYWELGHEFDWHYLTDADRSHLARQWEQSTVPWWDSLSALDNNTEDGLESAFAEVYAGCGLGWSTKGTTFALGPRAPVGHARSNSCPYIDKIAHRVGADMESARLARWNRRLGKPGVGR